MLNQTENALTFGLVMARHRLRLGLSQASLASIVGCSRQYVVQLESGQRQRPSLRITRALANALQLRGPEREELFLAAGYPYAGEGYADNRQELLRLAVEAIRGARYPAFVHDSLWHVYGWNEAAAKLFEIPAPMVVPGRTSVLEFVFDPYYRQRFSKWEPWARVVLAQFKNNSRGAIRQADAAPLLRRLRRLPDFRRLWDTVEAAPDGASTASVWFRHSRYGALMLRVLRMLYLDYPDIWVNMFLPGTSSTRDVFSSQF